VSEIETTQYNAPAYQEDECCEENGSRQIVSDIIYEKPLSRDDEQGPIFAAAEIAKLIKAKGLEVHESDSEQEEDDDTILEYCSEAEEGVANEVDSDDE
jgi:hypothetical protein